MNRKGGRYYRLDGQDVPEAELTPALEAQPEQTSETETEVEPESTDDAIQETTPAGETGDDL